MAVRDLAHNVAKRIWILDQKIATTSEVLVRVDLIEQRVRERKRLRSLRG